MAKSKHKKAPQKPAGQCIFCQGTGMTKQHIWPNWITRSDIIGLQDALLAPNNQQFLAGTSLIYGHESPIAILNEPRIVKHHGSILSRKLRMVCQKCNNGWMSEIEDESKEIIVSLQSHKQGQLTEAEQAKLTLWVGLMTIIAEFTDINSKSIPVVERKHFCDTKSVPAGWNIWIGKYKGNDWKFRYKHHGSRMRMLGSKPGQEQELISDERWQSSIFVIGGLLIFAISADSDMLNRYFSTFTFDSLVKIFPQTIDTINWSSLPVNSDADAVFISDSVSNEMREVGIGIGKDLNKEDPAK